VSALMTLSTVVVLDDELGCVFGLLSFYRRCLSIGKIRLFNKFEAGDKFENCFLLVFCGFVSYHFFKNKLFHK
jgi:hypothetical protein